MKRLLLLLLPLQFVSCTNPNQVSTQEQTEGATDTNFEIVAAKNDVADSMQLAKSAAASAAIVKDLSDRVTTRKDEFSTISWIEPKSKPPYRNQDGVYCYFTQDQNKVFNFRLAVQVVSDDLFLIGRYRFIVDGETFPYFSNNINRDNRDGKFWEYWDKRLRESDRHLIQALSKAGKAEIQFEGKDRTGDQTITRDELISIKDMFALYEAMGGKL